jgi:hypothetical protein
MKYLLIALFAAVSAHAADVVAPLHISNLAGCYTVSYRFVEDGKHDYEITGAIEWINLHHKDGVFTVQHYGLFGDEIMKHFYEDWSELPNGNWQQKVYGPGGNFRYTCVSPLKFGQMQCSSMMAPKPLRLKKRTDVDKLNRVSTIQLGTKSWVQSEVNELVMKDGTVVATEVGWIEYRRLADDKPCKRAMEQHPSGLAD